MLMQFPVNELYLKCAEEIFEVARKYVSLQEELNSESGATWGLIRNLFRTADYQNYISRTKDIKDRIERLRGRADLLPSPQFGPEQELSQALHDYIDALAVASKVCHKQAVFLARKAGSVSTPETSCSDSQQIKEEERHSVLTCLGAGRRVSVLYRLLSARIPPREC